MPAPSTPGPGYSRRGFLRAALGRRHDPAAPPDEPVAVAPPAVEEATPAEPPAGPPVIRARRTSVRPASIPPVRR